MMQNSTVLDLRKPSVTTGTEPQLYPIITWSVGVPVNIKKYSDANHTTLIHDITITWANGVPTVVSDHNVVTGVTKTTNIPWLNGLPFPL